MTRIAQQELEFFTTQELCKNAHWTNARNNFKPNVRVNDLASLPRQQYRIHKFFDDVIKMYRRSIQQDM